MFNFRCGEAFMLNISRLVIGTAVTALTLLSLASPTRAEDPIKNKECMDCHEDKTLSRTNAAGKEISLFMDLDKLNASAHKAKSCVSCHSDLTRKHPDDN